MENENKPEIRVICENSIANPNIRDTLIPDGRDEAEYVTVPELMGYIQELYSTSSNMLQDVLFLDTESDPDTKKPWTVQMLMNGEYKLIDHPKKNHFLKEWMSKAKHVVIFNAPYDMGVLSIRHGKKFKWVGDKWHMNIEGYHYEVRKMNILGSHIKSHGDAPKVFDAFKIWGLLVSGEAVSLEDIAWDEFRVKMIPYSEENSKTEAYQKQDVVLLAKVYLRFFERTKDLFEIAGYDSKDFENIHTQATFPKNEYAKVYSSMKDWRDHNVAENARFKLKYALDDAYNGGITCSLYRGTVEDTAWFDIHGAYAHVIEFENTDQYKLHTWKEIEPPEELPRDNHPILCNVVTDVVMMKINGSLKIFRLKHPTKRDMWSYDILAMRLLFPDANIKIISALEYIGLNPVSESLPSKWSAEKESRQEKEGKTPRVMFLKFLSNTSYGITAQSEPWATIHTNKALAGVITSRAHLILCEMIDEARKMGCQWLYSDTDSICVKLNGADPAELDKRLNKRISPYTCECELVGKTRILSLKRYIAYDGVDTEGNPVEDKIKIHGISIYNVTKEDILGMLQGKTNYDPLLIKQMTANTERTLNRLVKLCPETKKYAHPFMFVKDIPDPLGRSKQDWFRRTWFPHEDVKLDRPKGKKATEDYARDFFVFDSITQARLFYGDKTPAERTEPDVLITKTKVDWDAIDEYLFGDL